MAIHTIHPWEKHEIPRHDEPERKWAVKHDKRFNDYTGMGRGLVNKFERSIHYTYGCLYGHCTCDAGRNCPMMQADEKAGIIKDPRT